MISVVLLGTGNVSKNLFESFLNNSDIDVVQVIGRTQASLAYFKDRAKTATDWGNLPIADICILAINDDAIEEVSKLLNTDSLVIHTSGSVPIKALQLHKRYGVFYPLQTFTAQKIIALDEVPICIETEWEEDLEQLNKLGALLSNRIVSLSSEKRKMLHLSAVFVNNFANHMYTIASQICKENNLDFELLKPLIKETAAKLDTLTPEKAQTGPAKRGDFKTLHEHLTLLEEPQHREIYKLLSNAIKASYGEKL